MDVGRGISQGRGARTDSEQPRVVFLGKSLDSAIVPELCWCQCSGEAHSESSKRQTFCGCCPLAARLVKVLVAVCDLQGIALCRCDTEYQSPGSRARIHFGRSSFVTSWTIRKKPGQKLGIVILGGRPSGSCLLLRRDRARKNLCGGLRLIRRSLCSFPALKTTRILLGFGVFKAEAESETKQ